MTDPNTPEELDPAAAFQAMDRRLAGLTAAVDGLAVKLQEMHGRDYSPELAKIEGQFQAVRGAVKKFTELPAMVLTPEKIAAQIEVAGRVGRLADHQAWEGARRELQNAATSIDSVVTQARKGQEQKKRMTIAVNAALVVGLFSGGVGRDFIPWIAPLSWHWPEGRAAAILGRDKWAAGERLLEVADPERWRFVQAALRSIEDQSVETARSAHRKTSRVGSGHANGVRPRAPE